jgi:hypothetical protein
MSLSSAILASAIMIALVMLYGITNDRWRWRLFVKRATLALLAIAALSGAVIGGLNVWSRLPPILTRQTEYEGLRLGIGPDEVIYIKGWPPVVYGDLQTEGDWNGSQPVIETDKLEKGKTVRDYGQWAYEGNHSRVDITFNPEKTAIIAVQCCSHDKLSRRSPILGVRDGDTEKTVIEKLGAPAISRIEQITKYMSYPNLGVNLFLVKEQVYMIGINDTHYKRGS